MKSNKGEMKGNMELLWLRLEYAYCREKSILNIILKYEENWTVFEIWLLKVSLYFIVYANTLIKLMQKIGKICLHV